MFVCNNSCSDHRLSCRCKGGECYDVFPQLDSTVRSPAPSETKKAHNAFLYGLTTRWITHKCEDYVYIMYFDEEKTVSGISSLLYTVFEEFK